MGRWSVPCGPPGSPLQPVARRGTETEGGRGGGTRRAAVTAASGSCDMEVEMKAWGTTQCLYVLGQVGSPNLLRYLCSSNMLWRFQLVGKALSMAWPAGQGATPLVRIDMIAVYPGPGGPIPGKQSREADCRQFGSGSI